AFGMARRAAWFRRPGRVLRTLAQAVAPRGETSGQDALRARLVWRYGLLPGQRLYRARVAGAEGPLADVPGVPFLPTVSALPRRGGGHGGAGGAGLGRPAHLVAVAGPIPGAGAPDDAAEPAEHAELDQCAVDALL